VQGRGSCVDAGATVGRVGGKYNPPSCVSCKGGLCDAGAAVSRVVSVLLFERGMGTHVVAGVAVSHVLRFKQGDWLEEMYPSVSCFERGRGWGTRVLLYRCCGELPRCHVGLNGRSV